jgi:3-oxoacyl-[acyl-carrier-protein] synthase-1
MNLSEAADLPVSRLVPHAAPMILIDRAVSAGEDYFEAEVTIRPDSLFCDGAKVDAWVGIEYMAQAVAAYGGAEAIVAGRPVKTGFLLGTRSYECCVPSFPVGAVIRIGVKKVLHEPNGLSVVECSLRVHGEEEAMVTSNLTVFEVDNLAAYLAEHVK